MTIDAGHQGLDLGAGAALPGVRLRRGRRRRATGCRGVPRQRPRSGSALLADPDVADPARPGTLVAAGVRLPRPRRAPGLRRPARADARRGRPDLRRTGTRTTTAVERRLRRAGARDRRRRRSWRRPTPSRDRLRVGARTTPWQRTGRPQQRQRFTVATLGRYHLHDVVHHLHDVAGTARRGDGAAPTTPPPRPTATPGPRFPDAVPRPGGPVRRAAARRRPGARDRQRARPRRASRSRRPASRSAAPTSAPAFVELLRADGLRTPTCSTRSPTTWPTRRAPARPYDARVGQRLPAARRPRRPAERAGAASPGRPARAACCTSRSRRATARRWSVHGRVAAPAALHLLARGAAARRARGGGLVGPEHSRSDGLRDDRWLDVLATRRPREAHGVLGRLERALGRAYARSWASQYVIADLGGRTAAGGPRRRASRPRRSGPRCGAPSSSRHRE